MQAMKKECRGKRSGLRSGYTLVELMFALGVFTVVVFTAVATQATTANLIRTSRDTRTAVADLQRCMEQLLTIPPQDLPDPNGPYAAGQPLALLPDLTLENEVLLADYPGFVPGAAIPDPLVIGLTVNWNDFKGRPRSVRISTARGQ